MSCKLSGIVGVLWLFNMGMPFAVTAQNKHREIIDDQTILQEDSLGLTHWWSGVTGLNQEADDSWSLAANKYAVRFPKREDYQNDFVPVNGGKPGGEIYGLTSFAGLTAKDQVGSVGKMADAYHDYQLRLHLALPIVKDKLIFFSKDAFFSKKLPSQYLLGHEETSGILTVQDAQDIINAIHNRYGSQFDPGSAGVYNAEKNRCNLVNFLDWHFASGQYLRIMNQAKLNKKDSLGRDNQDFRFTSAAFTQEKKDIRTVLSLRSQWGERFSSDIAIAYHWSSEKRDPGENANLPDLEIAGRAAGSTIYIGTHRQASIYDMKEKAWSVTANFKWNLERHNLMLGAYAKRTQASFAYLNGWNGRVNYLSIQDFIDNHPFRVRGAYSYRNNNRDDLLSHPSTFDVYALRVSLQDEVHFSDRLVVSFGLLGEYTYLPDKPEFSDEVKSVLPDPYFGRTYSYTPLRFLDNDLLHKIQLSPRLNFIYNWLGDHELVLRGGIGLETEQIPYNWLTYFYRHNGKSFASYSQEAYDRPFAEGADPVIGTENGISEFIARNGVDITRSEGGKTGIFLMDNDFVMPQFLRANFIVDYNSHSGWNVCIQGMYGNTVKDLFFQDINIQDNPLWLGYDTNHEQPVYSGNVDPRFSSIYLLKNTKKGWRYRISADLNRQFGSRWGFDLFYSYGKIKNVASGVSGSMEANRQLNQALIPNDPELEASNDDIRHRVKLDFNYDIAWSKGIKTKIILSVKARSGSPFTFGIINDNIQGLSQWVSLAYIPTENEAIHFFKNLPDITAAQQAASFNRYIDKYEYLREHRGQFTHRNGARTPWSFQADLSLMQDVLRIGHQKKTLTFLANVINFTNLLSPNWGKQYFTSATWNSTASIGLTPVYPRSQNSGTYPAFRFNDPGKPYSVDYLKSRARVQLGLRYTF